MTPRQLAPRARAALRKAADARVKARQRSYCKPWERVSLYGVATPEVSGLERGLYQLVRTEWRYADAVAFCGLLKRDRYIESKSLGLMLLARYRRQYPEALLRHVKGWLAGNFCDNWAITDQLSTQIVSILIDRFRRWRRRSVHAVIDATQLWTGELDRDTHLKSADFLDVAHCPQILFESSSVRQDGANHYKASGNVTIRGVARPLTLGVMYLGQWETPYWENGVDKGPVTRAGFRATTTTTTSINRHDFGISWNSVLDRGGIVVGDEVFIDIDVEALKQQ